MAKTEGAHKGGTVKEKVLSNKIVCCSVYVPFHFYLGAARNQRKEISLNIM